MAKSLDIEVTADASKAVKSLGLAKTAIHGVSQAFAAVSRTLGWFHLAVNGVKMLVDGFKWLQEKIDATRFAAERLKLAVEMKGLALATDRLVGSHTRLAALLKDELDTISKQKAVADISKNADRDLADRNLAAYRARRIYEAATPEERQRLRDQFADEDDQRELRRKRQDRAAEIAVLEDSDSAYGAKIHGNNETVANINAQIDRLDRTLRSATPNDDQRSAIRAQIESLVKEKTDAEKEIVSLERERAHIRAQIAALQSITDFDLPSAGHYERLTAAKEKAETEAKQKAEREKRKADATEKAERRKVLDDEIAVRSERASGLDAFANALAAGETVSSNRLTAMGLGAGVHSRESVSADVKRLVDLLKQQIKATKDLRDQTDVAVYGD